ncbi:MAG: hypothetical protein WCO00_05205, partial [Rhodospirillaceae bacterium]
MSFPSPAVAPYEPECRRIRQQIIALVVAFSAVIWGAFFFYVQTTRAASISMAERGTASLALAFEQSVSRRVTGIDQSLLTKLGSQIRAAAILRKARKDFA